MTRTREDIYRAALAQIADEESGVWGTIAHRALLAGDEQPRPEPEPEREQPA